MTLASPLSPPPAAEPPSIEHPLKGTPFTRWAGRHPWWFGLLGLLLTYAAKLAVSPAVFVFGEPDLEIVAELGTTPGLLLLMLAMMPLETLIGQQFPVWLLRKFKMRRWLPLCLWSGLLFGLLHTPGGPVIVLATAAAGAAFSFCWIVWRKTSWKFAFLGTTAVHVAHNLIAILFVALANG